MNPMAVLICTLVALMLEPNPGLSSEPVRSGSAEVTTAREAVQATPSSGPRITNPQEHLRPFVEFLHRDGAEPKAFLLKALASHQVVIMGEIHHRPRYWAFNSSLVRDKAFAERVGVIYMELPSNDQALVEQFLAAPTEDTQPVSRHCLTYSHSRPANRGSCKCTGLRASPSTASIARMAALMSTRSALLTASSSPEIQGPRLTTVPPL